MTRKQALKIAITVLNKQQNEPIVRDIIPRLQEIYDELPLVHWSNASIFDAIEQWKIDNGEYPSTSDLNKRGLPSKSVIKQKTKQNPINFLKKNFPRASSREHISPYIQKSKEEWLDIFIQEYMRIQPKYYYEYENKRNKYTPTARWLMKQFKIHTWNDLLKYAGINKGNNIKNRTFNILNKSDLFC